MPDEDTMQPETCGVVHHRARDEQTADTGPGSDLHCEGGSLYGLNDPLGSIADPPTAAGQEPILATSEMSEAASARLPQELIERVISFLWDFPAAVDACKLVSRACYSYISTFSGILRLHSARAFSVFAKSSMAAEKLRDVHILHLRDSATPWLHRLPLLLCPALTNVTRLYLFDWSLARMPLHPAVLPAFAHLRSVSMLFLSDCRFESAAQLQRLIGAFPGLHELSLYGVYVPAQLSVAGANAVVCRPPPRLTYLALGSSYRKKPEKGVTNVAGALAAWFSKDEKRLQELQHVFIWITYAYLRDGESVSIGQLVAAVGAHITRLGLDLDEGQSDLPDHAADLSSLRLDSCAKVQTLWVYRSSPEFHVLALLSPDCLIKTLFLAQGTWYHERRATDWAALAAVLEGSAYNELKRVVNHARIPQSPVETEAMRTFIERMHARGVILEDRTEFPYL